MRDWVIMLVFVGLFGVLLVSGCFGGETIGENIDKGINKTADVINGTINWLRS